MSVRTVPAQHVIVCDRCTREKNIGNPDNVPPDWMIVSTAMPIRGMTRYYALCPDCAPALDDFFKKPSATGRRTP